MSRALKDPAFRALAQLGKALGHPHRLELLRLVLHAPRDVESLARGTERSVASTSQHLQVLARAHLVTRKREGARIIYALAEGVSGLLHHMEQLSMERDPALRMVWQDWRDAHPAVRLVGREEMQRLVDSEAAVLIDLRPSAEFDHGHLPRAHSLPLDELHERIHELPFDREIITVCRGRWCAWADTAVEDLLAAGFLARKLEG